MNKKALSPLSSTIILLVVSIIIGIVVMQWGRGYVEQAATPDVSQPEKQDTLLADLNKELSQGKITKEQYDKIKEVLLEQS